MLHKLQSSFLKGIYDASAESDTLPFIQETVDKTAAEQFSIYRGSIFGGLKKALAETYPVTKDLVGEDFFNMMLGQYIKQYPCKVQDLNDYGEQLSAFIQNLKQARSGPYLADMARLEWLYNIALNSKPQKNNLDEVSQLTPEQQCQLTLLLPTGSAIMQSDYPLDKIWAMNWEDNNCDKENEIECKDEEVFLIIWKNVSKVYIDILSEQQFYFLDGINNQASFVTVCDSTIKTYPGIDINTLFTEAIKKGWIQSYTI